MTATIASSGTKTFSAAFPAQLMVQLKTYQLQISQNEKELSQIQLKASNIQKRLLELYDELDSNPSDELVEETDDYLVQLGNTKLHLERLSEALEALKSKYQNLNERYQSSRSVMDDLLKSNKAAPSA